MSIQNYELGKNRLANTYAEVNVKTRPHRVVVHFQDLHASIVIDIRNCVALNWYLLCGRVVVVKVGGLPHASRRRHHYRGFVVSQTTAAFPTFNDSHKAFTEFLIKISVEDRINAAIG